MCHYVSFLQRKFFLLLDDVSFTFAWISSYPFLGFSFFDFESPSSSHDTSTGWEYFTFLFMCHPIHTSPTTSKEPPNHNQNQQRMR